MWDEQDHFGRWVQGISAIFLAVFAAACAYFIYTSTIWMIIIGGITLFLGSVRLCWRCAFYAVTGRNNVNRDGY